MPDEQTLVAKVAEAHARLDSHDETIKRHDEHLARLDETTAALRVMVATVATKDDIHALSDKMGERHDKQLQRAYDAIPGKWVAIFTGLTVLIMLLDLIRHIGM
ncbi:MAG: hypothetical protein M0T84_00350 [Betaproteobacteria bacterium]|nr:hypothetical protein [Betaproteobacteria bacterium]